MHAVNASIAALALLASSTALAAPKFKDCAPLGPIAGYAATQAPDWRHWDTRALHIDDGKGGETDVSPAGEVCVQDYAEDPGKTDGSILEITENYKQAMRQLGAEIKRTDNGYVVGHVVKDGQELWLQMGATRDDGFELAVIKTAAPKSVLLPPSGKDYRLIGHMPGYTAEPPEQKRFDAVTIPTSDGDLSIKGKLYRVTYDAPAVEPSPRITNAEILENYREALHDLHAQTLRDDGVGAENISARFDDHGQLIYMFITPNQVTAVEEKPFEVSLVAPTADTMKDALDKDGHIALYVNFDFDKASLKSDAAPVIAQVVGLLKRNPALKVSIEGHTDNIGGHDYNMKLSGARAASVVAAVVAGGIDGGRLSSAGFGPDKPIAPNETDEGRAKNRRVELVKAP